MLSALLSSFYLYKPPFHTGQRRILLVDEATVSVDAVTSLSRLVVESLGMFVSSLDGFGVSGQTGAKTGALPPHC